MDVISHNGVASILLVANALNICSSPPSHFCNDLNRCFLLSLRHLVSLILLFSLHPHYKTRELKQFQRLLHCLERECSLAAYSRHPIILLNWRWGVGDLKE